MYLKWILRSQVIQIIKKMEKKQCIWDLLLKSIEKYFLYKYKKKKILKIQFNIYFQEEEAVMASIQIEEKQKVKNRVLDNLEICTWNWIN